MKKRHQLITFIIFISNLIFAQVPTNGLVAYYTLGNNLKDYSGNKNDGIVIGEDPITAIDRFEHQDSARFFNIQKKNFIQIQNSNSLDSFASITVSVWINSLGMTNDNQTIIGKWNGSLSNQSWTLDLSYHSTQPQFGIRRSNGEIVSLISNKSLAAGEWYNITCVYDGINTSLYINGKRDSMLTHTSNFSIIPANTTVTIGAHDELITSDVNRFNGGIDDIRIYNRALSENEILALYNNQSIEVSKIPIIFIPGIMGSPLYDDLNNNNLLLDEFYSDKNERIWFNSLVPQQFLYDLQLDDSGENPLNKNNNIKVAPIRGDISNTLKDNYETKLPLSVYKGLFMYFDTKGYQIDDTGQMEANSNTNLFCFTYDWRKSVIDNGNKLSDYINKVLAWTGVQTVNIIAHSLGGLVTKSCVKNNGSDRIDKIIFVGTPHLGAPKIYYTMLTGDVEFGFFKDIFLINKIIKDISRNMPSTYELFPSAEYFNAKINRNISGNDLYNYSILNAHYTPLISNIEYFGYNDAIKFFENLQVGSNNLYNVDLIESAKTIQDNLSNVDFKDIDVYNIVGYNTSTIGQIWVRNLFNNQYSQDAIYNLDGDGTVPLKSSETINGNIYNPNKTFYIKGGNHQALPSDKNVLDIINNILNDSANNSYNLPQEYKYSNSNWLQTIVACPVIVNAYDDFGNKTGPTSDTTYIEGIPGSKYIPANLLDPESKKIFLLPRNGEYRFEINSQDTNSTFDFSVLDIKDGNMESLLTIDSIKMENNTKAFCKVDSTISKTIMYVDTNGDGSIDTTYNSNYSKITSTKNLTLLPSIFSLSQNFPNPFNPTTRISYTISEQSKVVLIVYDILGRKIKTLIDKIQSSGNYSIEWNASEYPSGVYFYKLQAGEFTETKKMILLK
ncbi:MAG: T9SS type A sorting domain-containing protein [Ignavibacteriae bacterium]|nr:T9SS type A sorting domain-containing protein [Ignavibacteriota bacterium]